mgnify:CR=1 FL=1
MMDIFEGLQEGDLNNLVLPTISVDEFDSKLDDTAIVVGFYVDFKEPAEDLNRFIQKSPEDLIDTDISPAPDEDGNYMVFLELTRDKNFPERLVNIVNSLDSLTGNKEWSFRAYGSDKTYPLTAENLKKRVDLKVPEEDEDETVDQDDLEEFFKPSVCDDIIFENTDVVLTKGFNELRLGVVDFNSYVAVQENNQLARYAVMLNESSQSTVTELMGYFGPGWLVECLSNGLIYITHDYSNDALLAIKE